MNRATSDASKNTTSIHHRRTRADRKPPTELTVVDLFAGAGGLSEGFRQAGYRVIAGSDIDPDAAETFRANFPTATVITGDIRQPRIHAEIAEAAMGADVIVGGPPCQAFSQVRNHSRLINDPRNSLYQEFVGTIRRCLPRAFLMENVTGVDQLGVREQIVADLSLDGEYRVAPQIVDAADFGVPQTRKRLLFVGVHRSLGAEPPRLQGSGAISSIALLRFPGPRRTRYKMVVDENVLSQRVYAALLDPENLLVVSAAQAISDLNQLPPGNRADEFFYEKLPPASTAYQRLMRTGAGAVLHNTQVPRINIDTALRLAKVPEGGNHRDLPEELLERYISGKRWGQDNGSGKLSRRHFYAYRRLFPDLWAWTLNTKADSVYHYRAARSLSVREFCRLQSFPDTFIVSSDPRKGPLPGRHDGGAAHSRYRQVGNAVPPLLAQAVAAALRDVLRAVHTSRAVRTA